jgi:hypothetical protein
MSLKINGTGFTPGIVEQHKRNAQTAVAATQSRMELTKGD